MVRIEGGIFSEEPAYKKVGELFRFSLYEASGDAIMDIGTYSEGDLEVTQVVSGAMSSPILPEDVAYTLAANPCIAILPITKKGNLYIAHIFHILASTINKEEMKILDESIGGIAGGSPMVEEKMELLLQHNITFIPPRTEDADKGFNLAIVRRKLKEGKKLKFQKGIYYNYT